jgi:DNA-binding MarR family transcriptional regulator
MMPSREVIEMESTSLYETGLEGELHFRQVGLVLIGLSRRLQDLGSRTRAGRGVSPEQAFFLIELARAGTITIRKRGARAGEPQPVRDRFAKKLVRKGLANRTRDWDDRRVIHFTPTAAGREFAEELLQEYTHAVAGAFEGASWRERDAFLTMLTLIDESLTD